MTGLDLAALHGRLRSVEDRQGRPAAGPEILVALWLYATLRGVGGARRTVRAARLRPPGGRAAV